MTWQCFVIEPTGQDRRMLRRYARTDGGCALGNYHHAEVQIDDAPADGAPIGDTWPHDDPRWPTHCACGYAFATTDHWQLFLDTLYRAPDGTICTLRDAPIGAMWRATWFEEAPAWVGPDGQCWVVMLPPGGLGNEWVIDGASASGGHWQRTGTAPRFTATPSILTPRYHGFLQDGVLTADTEGRFR